MISEKSRLHSERLLLRPTIISLGFTSKMSTLDHRARITKIEKRSDSNHIFGLRHKTHDAGDKGHNYDLVLHSPADVALLEGQLEVHLPDDYPRLL